MILQARDYASGVIGHLQSRLANLSRGQKFAAAGFAAAAVGGAAVAYEAAKFADSALKHGVAAQQALMYLHTQAGVPIQDLARIGDTANTMAAKYGQSVTGIINAWYQAASAGFPNFHQQMDLTQQAINLANVGGSDLNDTMSALVAIVKSAVPGFHGAGEAAAYMNAIVGAGNMHMQDLVGSLGSGLPAVLKTFGVSFQSAGAALDFFTDRGVHANIVANRLRMTIPLMAAPTEAHARILHALGLSYDEIHSKYAVVSQDLEKAHISYSQLALDLKKPDGLLVALSDLKDRMTSLNLGPQWQSSIVAGLFGGGHMGTIAMGLFSQLDSLKQKFNQIQANAANFGGDVRDSMTTAAFGLRDLHTSVDSVKTSIGEGLLPVVQTLLKAITPVVQRIADWTTKHKTLAAVILGAVIGFGMLAAVIGMVGLALLGLTVGAPVIVIMLILAATAALTVGLMWLMKHWRQVWGDIKKIAAEAMPYLRDLLYTTWNRIVADAEMTWSYFEGWLGTVWGDIQSVANDAWNSIASFLGSIWTDVSNAAISVWNAITRFLTSVWNGIKSVASTVWGAIVGFFKAIWDGLSDAWSATWHAIVTAVEFIWNGLKSVANTVWSAIKTAVIYSTNEVRDGVEAVWNGIKLVVSAVWNALGSVANTIWSGIKTAITTATNAVRDVVIAVWNGIKTALTTVWNALVSASKSAWAAMLKVWSTAEKWFEAFKTKVVALFKDAKTWLVDAGKAIMNGLWDGLKSVWSSIEGWIKSMVDSIPSFFRSALGIHSPSTVFQSIGENIMTGLQQGLQTGLSGVSAQMSVTANTVTGAGRGMVGSPVGGAGGVTINNVLQFQGPGVWKPSDVDNLVNQIGTRLARVILPTSGMQLRRA